MNEFVAIARALSHPTRVRALKLLERGEMCVCEIQALVGGVQSTISKHLGILLAAGLVAVEKRGLWAYYRLATDPAGANCLAFLSLLRDALNDDPVVREDAAQAAAAQTCCGGDQQ